MGPSVDEAQAAPGQVVEGPTPSRHAATEILTVVANEFHKGMLNLWAHRIPVLGGMAVSGGLYLAMMLVIGRGRLPKDLLPLTVVAMAAYLTLWVGSLQMVADQLEEMRAGVLEQAHLSPVPPWLLVLGRLASSGLQGVLVAAGLAVGVALGAHVSIAPRWEVVVPAALTLVDVLAFNLLFAGIVLTAPFIGEIHHVTTGVVALFNGAYLPVALFPGWLQPIARLLPSTLGVEAMLKVLYGSRSLGEVWSGGTLPLLILHTAALTALAWLVFVGSYQRALRDGGLGRY